IPIGRPITNMQIYILGRFLQPVPIGVVGDLYVGGEGVGRGYLGDGPLTAVSFIPNPFSSIPGLRLYKTGDLARYQPDGNIEFLGRGDHQVKLRGYRIELGEIEATLIRHPLVRECTVMLREDEFGEMWLVAYVVIQESLPTDELRRFLQEQIPKYMVPAAFIALERFPLTPNGKVDRAALPRFER